MPADLAAYGEGTSDTPAETVVNGTELVHVPADDTAVHGKGPYGVHVEVAAPWDAPSGTASSGSAEPSCSHAALAEMQQTADSTCRAAAERPDGSVTNSMSIATDLSTNTPHMAEVLPRQPANSSNSAVGKTSSLQEVILDQVNDTQSDRNSMGGYHALPSEAGSPALSTPQQLQLASIGEEAHEHDLHVSKPAEAESGAGESPYHNEAEVQSAKGDQSNMRQLCCSPQPVCHPLPVQPFLTSPPVLQLPQHMGTALWAHTAYLGATGCFML